MRDREWDDRGEEGSSYYDRPQMALDPEGPAKIRALHAAYRSLNWVLVANLVLVFGLNGGSAFWTGTADTPNPLLMLFVGVATTFAVVYAMSRTPC